MELHTSRLRALREGASLDLATLAALARIDPAQLERAEEGGPLDLPEGAAKRLARVLGADLALVAVVREEGDGDPVYDDSEPVMASAPEPTRQRPPTPEPLDVDPTPPFERALLAAVAEGGFEEEDQQLVMGVLSQGTLPATVTPREMPAFARVWLDAARALRRAGVSEEDRVAPLLERIEAEGPRSAAKMAADIRETLKRKGRR